MRAEISAFAMEDERVLDLIAVARATAEMVEMRMEVVVVRMVRSSEFYREGVT